MASLDRPKIRPTIFARRFEHEGRAYAAIQDELGVLDGPLPISLDGYQRIVRRFDGRTSLIDIQGHLFRETGQRVAIEELERLVDHLDRAMVLDGPTFASFHESYRQAGVRPPSHAGRSYPGTEGALRAQLDRHFAHPRGSGLPFDGFAPPAAPLRGVLSPHIDFQRGGPVYTWAYKALVEQSDADTFVVLGVAHQPCRHRFALTRKDFETPLGLARTDRGFVDRIASEAGAHLFEDELAHRTEHSIEFQVVFLQYLLGPRRAFSIVPILVGSFHDLMTAGTEPIDAPEVARFVEALRAAEASSGKKVAYVGGIDLCHVGPEFGDPGPLDAATLDTVRAFDAAMLDRAGANDPAGWFAMAAAVENRWRVCGLAAAYTMLRAIGPARGRLLSYDQAVNPERTCGVSFASMVFEGVSPGPATSHEVRPRV